ncbi:putative RNA-binding Zn ribbon-like protein [Pseudoclavibacter chungangensis]|nr:ABATE domain-containing protein [Pseudoclavibacter chungangensis]NYJ65753.1 putative RNA-binding Zn ribbon-like protein [Pseudoclavibacter chungangensis]
MGTVRGEPAFRMDNDVLAFRFTETLAERFGDRVERLPTPERFGQWLEANGLRFDEAVPTRAELRAAQALREVVYRVGATVAQRGAPDPVDVEALNAASRRGRAYVELRDGVAALVSGGRRPVIDALGVIAQDAIGSVAGAFAELVSVCADPSCRGLFLDMSPATNRRWCSMNTCGNRAKKAAMAERRQLAER